MDYLAGGELFWHLHERERPPTGTIDGEPHWGWGEEQVRLYVSELALGLAYLHQHNIVYRDLKPENVLMDVRGHLHLVDFGLSVSLLSDSVGAGGTLEYVPPEMLLGRTQTSVATDWWALGVLMWEMLAAEQPFGLKGEAASAGNPHHVTILTEQVLGELQFPSYFSQEACDTLQALLEPLPEKRLGTEGGAWSLQDSPFFRDKIDFSKVANLEIDPVYVPGDVVETHLDPTTPQLVDTAPPTKSRFFDFTFTSFRRSGGLGVARSDSFNRLVRGRGDAENPASPLDLPLEGEVSAIVRTPRRSQSPLGQLPHAPVDGQGQVGKRGGVERDTRCKLGGEHYYFVTPPRRLRNR